MWTPARQRLSRTRLDGVHIGGVEEGLAVGVGQRFAEQSQSVGDAPGLGGERLPFDFHFRQIGGRYGESEDENTERTNGDDAWSWRNLSR